MRSLKYIVLNLLLLICWIVDVRLMRYRDQKEDGGTEGKEKAS